MNDSVARCGKNDLPILVKVTNRKGKDVLVGRSHFRKWKCLHTQERQRGGHRVQRPSVSFRLTICSQELNRTVVRGPEFESVTRKIGAWHSVDMVFWNPR
jgi:hypothetical protein